MTEAMFTKKELKKLADSIIKSHKASVDRRPSKITWSGQEDSTQGTK